MIVSASTLALWMECPLKAKRTKLEGRPTRQNAKASFGTCIHHALDLYNQTGDVELAKATFLDVWQFPEKLGVAPDYWPRMMSWGSLKNQGLEALQAFHENIKWDTREVLFTEHPFLVPFGRHQLKGIVDMGELRKSGKGELLLRVVDFKTNSRAPSRAELTQNTQFTVYVFASQQPEFWMGVDGNPDYPGLPNGEMLYSLYNDLPRRAIWWHLLGPKELDAGPRDDSDYMRLYRLIDEVEKAMERDVFVPRIGESSCSICDFTAECGLRIPTREEELEDPHAWI